jgi:hypothetical protein
MPCPTGYTLKTGQIGIATPGAPNGTVWQPTYACANAAGGIYSMDCSGQIEPTSIAILAGGALGLLLFPGWTKILPVAAAAVLYFLNGLSQSAYSSTDANGNTTCAWGPTSW